MQERLKDLRNAKQLTQAEFAKLLGVSQPAYGNYENGNRKISVDLAIKICDITNCNIEWLLTGKNSMFHKGENEKQPTMEQCSANELVRVELGTQIAAGIPLPAEHDGHVYLPKSLLKGYKPENFCAFPVNGDSMEPQILHGSLAIVRYSDNWFEANDKVAAVMVDGEVTLKLIRADNNLRHYLLLPFNPNHHHIAVNPQSTDMRLVGILHATVRYWEKADYSQ